MNQILSRQVDAWKIGLALRALIVLVIVSVAGRSVAEDDSDSELQRQQARMAELRQQLDQQRITMQAVQQELQQRQVDLKRQQAEAESQFVEAQRRYQELQARAAEAAAKDRQVAVYALKYLPAADAAEAITRVLNPKGNDELSLAVDERANRLIASSTSTKIKAVADLLQSLDVKAAESAASPVEQAASEMLQVRVIWLAEGAATSDADSATGKVDARVLEALRPLGFASSHVACQTVTSVVVTKGQNDGFAFTAPVTLDGTVLQFHGSGKIKAENDRYLVQVELAIASATARGGGFGGQIRNCQVQGAISTPLTNYTILGTGVVVTASGAESGKPKQVPCAFVLQLNRAEEFSVGGGSAAAGE